METLLADDPRQIARYRLLAALGKGGMGRVFLGVAPDGLLVAVKQVHAHFVADKGFRGRFRREVTASRRVSGAYTAPVVDADPGADTPWLASAFIVGPSLRRAVDVAGPLPEQALRRLAAGLASALLGIHQAGLIHRDLKPDNVILAEEGPRVIDFGIARAADDSGGTASTLTRTGMLVGSPAYMSPEQAEGLSLTAASDVFSLGVLLVTAATGKNPFVGDSALQTLYNVVHREPDLSGLPEALRELVARCLAKDPARRPTPEEVLAATAVEHVTATPWPPEVHAAIDAQRAEVRDLLAQQNPLPPTTQPAPLTSAARRSSSAPAPVSPAPRIPPTPWRSRRSRARLLGVLGGATVVVAAVVAVALLPDGTESAETGAGTSTASPHSSQASLDAEAVKVVAQQVEEAVEAVFTYDQADAVNHQERVSRYLTGAALGQVAQMISRTTETSTANGVRYSTTARQVAVKTVTGDKAELLVIADQTATRTATQQTTSAQASLSVTAQLVDDRWVIAGIQGV